MGGTKALMPFSHNVNPSMYDVIIYVYLGLAYDMAFVHFTTKQLVISRLMLCSVKDRQVAALLVGRCRKLKGPTGRWALYRLYRQKCALTVSCSRQFPIASSGLLHSSSATQIAPYAAVRRHQSQTYDDSCFTKRICQHSDYTKLGLCGNNGIVVIELGRLVQQVPLDRQLSLPLNQCLRSIDQHFLPMHCQDRRDQKQENLVTQILFQVRVVNALSLPACWHLHILTQNYSHVCHGKVVINSRPIL